MNKNYPIEEFDYSPYNQHQSNHQTPIEKTRFYSFIGTIHDQDKPNEMKFPYTSTKISSIETRSNLDHSKSNVSYKYGKNDDQSSQINRTNSPKPNGPNCKQPSILELCKIRELNKINMKSNSNKVVNSIDNCFFCI